MIFTRTTHDCPSTQIYHDASYTHEVYAWTILGVLAFIARYSVRLRILPLKKLQGDDWAGIAVLLCFVSLTAAKLTTYHLGANTDYTEEAILGLSTCQLERVIVGSKFQISGWYFYACFLWSLKAMVLFLFSRLSLSPHQQRLHFIFTIFSVLSFIAVILTISFGCRPFHLNWGTIPYPPQRCLARPQNFYTTSILNVATDACILSIALPTLWSLRVPLKRKIALTLLLCSGIFVISAAVVAMLMSLLDADSTLNTNRWATREEIAGILAVNAPIIKPIFYPSFWRRDFDPHRERKTRKAVPAPHDLAPADPTFGATMLSAPPAKMKRLGLLSSIQSAYFAGLSRRTERSTISGTEVETGKFASSTTQEVDCEVGTKVKELDAAWMEKREDEDAVAYVPRSGPRPLLPEPSHSWTTTAEEIPWSGLQSIGEEDDRTEEKKM